MINQDLFVCALSISEVKFCLGRRAKREVIRTGKWLNFQPNQSRIVSFNFNSCISFLIKVEHLKSYKAGTEKTGSMGDLFTHANLKEGNSSFYYYRVRRTATTTPI